jgi:hypothetical protein
MADMALANGDDGLMWLRVDEAAARLGLHPSALRSRVARGQHPHRKDNHGRVLAAVPAASAPPSSDELSHRHDEELAALRRRVDELTLSLTDARVALAKAEAVGAIATAKAEAEVSAQRELVSELRAMLADARRPWWRRWLGLVLLLVTVSVPQLAGAAESRMCGVRGSTIEEAFAKCRSGDTIFTALPNMKDAGFLAARVCDFGQGMLVERQGEKPEDGAILACVYVGRVRSLAE